MPGLITLLALGLALYWGVVVAHIVRTLRRPPRRTYASAVARGLVGSPEELPSPLATRHWSFVWEGLRLPVWDVAVNDSGPVVIMTHGWASSRLGALRRMPALVEAGAGRLIAWDLPGHGEAPGVSTLGLREPEALVALVEEARRQGDGGDGGEEGERRAIVLYGSSMGAGISIAAAASPGVEVAMVIAEAPYRLAVTPAAAVLRERGVPPLGRLRPALAVVGMLAGAGPRWGGRRFDRAEVARAVRCPLVVIHGACDTVCPLADAEAIAAAAPAGRLVEVEGAGHRDLWSEAFAERATGALREALGEVMAGAGEPAARESSAGGADARCGAKHE